MDTATQLRGLFRQVQLTHPTGPTGPPDTGGRPIVRPDELDQDSLQELLDQLDDGAHCLGIGVGRQFIGEGCRVGNAAAFVGKDPASGLVLAHTLEDARAVLASGEWLFGTIGILDSLGRRWAGFSHDRKLEVRFAEPHSIFSYLADWVGEVQAGCEATVVVGRTLFNELQAISDPAGHAIQPHWSTPLYLDIGFAVVYSSKAGQDVDGGEREDPDEISYRQMFRSATAYWDARVPPGELLTYQALRQAGMVGSAAREALQLLAVGATN